MLLGGVAGWILGQGLVTLVTRTINDLYFVLTVREVGGRLAAQATGQPAFPIFAESETEFFLKVVDAQLTFTLDDTGVVDGLILHQGGANQPARKVR